MITVVCVLRSGGIYDASWVDKLQRGVARHLSLSHRFVCLTDMVRDVQSAGIEAIPLPESWPGWWSKMCLWSPTVGLNGPTFYLDLDSIIVGSLDPIVAYPHTFTGAHDFYGDNFCSTAMAWDGDFRFLYERFATDPGGIARRYDQMLATHGRIGDQAAVEDWLKDAGIIPDQFRHVISERSIASYKVHQCQDAPPADAAIVSMHGNPKPHQLTTGWVPQVWR